jgi:hypothetical protein
MGLERAALMRGPQENKDGHEDYEDEAKQGSARCDYHAVILALP